MTGTAASTGARVTRWLLLACTILGLTAMHTLGHAGMASPDRHAAAAPMSLVAGAPVSLVAAVSAVPSLGAAEECVGDHCPGGPGHGMSGGWSVCLAILTGLAVAVLLALVLFAVAPSLAAQRVPCLLVSRAPPGRPLASTITATTVLRI